MTAHVRTPFAALDSPRLQTLSSMKNRQNAVTAALNSKANAGKETLNMPSKRRASTALFDEQEDFDTENIDPELFNTKRSKAFDGTPQKPSKFTLNTVPPHSAPPASTKLASTTLSQQSSTKRSSLSPLKTTTTITPVSARGGSPKHKRIGLLSKRRTSTSPFQRVDPPSLFTRSTSSSLPFSLDAALSGTLSSYTPKTDFKPEPKAVEPAMPKSWFFDIHVDTAEEEATNLMEHSACVLDISSDDDSVTRLANEMREQRGKENIPPADHLSNASGANGVQRSSPLVNEVLADGVEAGLEKVKMGLGKGSLRRRKFDADAMVEDRAPLGALPVEEYYAAVPEPKVEGQVEVQQEQVVEEAAMPVEICAQPELEASSTEAPVQDAALVPEESTEPKDIVVFEDAPTFTTVPVEQQVETASQPIEDIIS